MRDGQAAPGAGPAETGPAFAVTVAFDLHPDCRERFLGLVTANAAASIRSEPGCRRFDVLVPADPPGLEDGTPDVLLYEVYASRAAFEAHLASAHFSSFDAATRAMVRRKTVATFAVADGAAPAGATVPEQPHGR